MTRRVALVRPLSLATRHAAMTVVIAGPFPPPTYGVSAVLAATAAALASRCKVVRADLSSGSLARGIRHHIRRGRRLVAAISSLLRCARGPRNLYLSSAGSFGNLYCLVLCAVGRVLGYRVFLDHHNFSYLDRPSVVVSALIRIAGRSAVHAVLSPNMGRRLVGLYGSLGAVTTVSNAARIVAQKEPPTAHDGPLVIGHLSNLTWDKGLDVVLDLFLHLVAQGIDVRLELAGPASGSELVAIEAARVGAEGRLIWRGPVYGEDKLNFLRSLDFFCFPTQYKNEAQPLVLFEALSCGVPVLAFGRGCIPEDIVPDFGIVVPISDDFVATVMPLIGRWAKDRKAVEDLRFRAWAAYCAAHEAARKGLVQWLDRLVEFDGIR